MQQDLVYRRVFDGNQRKIRYDRSIVKMNTVSFEKVNFNNRQKVYKDMYLSEIKLIDNRIEIVESQLNEYEKIKRFYFAEFVKGKLDIMDLKDLERDVALKKQQSLFLEIEKQVLINSYNYWNF